MDAHITAHLPVEEESPAPSARVAGETDAPFLEGGFREENPKPGVRLPEEAEEPSALTAAASPSGERRPKFCRRSAPPPSGVRSRRVQLFSSRRPVSTSE